MQKPSVILLFQDVESDKFINGIFFDVKTNLAKRHYALDGFYAEDAQVSGESDWVPLQQMLDYWLKHEKWGNMGSKWTATVEEIYTCCPGRSTTSTKASKHGTAFLMQSNTASQTNKTQPAFLQPKKSLLEDQNYNSFATAFLTRASLPSFKFIAPGITYLTNNLFQTLHASNGPKDNILGGSNNVKETYQDEDEDSRINLLFPFQNPIPFLGSLSRNDRGFDFEHSYLLNAKPGSGLAQVTVDRMGGLYSWISYGVKLFEQMCGGEVEGVG